MRLLLLLAAVAALALPAGSGASASDLCYHAGPWTPGTGDVLVLPPCVPWKLGSGTACGTTQVFGTDELRAYVTTCFPNPL